MELNVCIVCQDQKVAVVERWPLLEVQLYCSVYSLYFLKIQTWWLGGFQHEDPMNGNKKKNACRKGAMILSQRNCLKVLLVVYYEWTTLQLDIGRYISLPCNTICCY